jgi:hypothetical protein
MSSFDSPAPCKPSCNDVLGRLAEGHEHTRALADDCLRLARSTPAGATLQQQVDALCRAIHRLAALEENYLYPVARDAQVTPSLVDMALLEHATARQIIRLLQDVKPSEARHGALVVALADCMERHARHEQEKLFPPLRISAPRVAELEKAVEACVADVMATCRTSSCRAGTMATVPRARIPEMAASR